MVKACYFMKVGLAGKLNLNSGCRGNAGQDGRIQILFSRQVYSSPQGRLS